MLRSSIQQGRVFHRRIRPREHAFAYPVFMSLIDISEIDRIFARSRLWSLESFNLVSFHRSDYIGGGDTIENCVRNEIFKATGRQFQGRVFMLTHMRYLGFCFNPVSFYFCYEHAQDRPRFILAEINNTPWNERHCYVLETATESGPLHFVFDKEFHVSPFMSMEIEYRWRFEFEDGIRINMALDDGESVCFAAGMELEPLPFTTSNMRWTPLRYPLITLTVVWRIYWQALLLRLKRVPFYSHPNLISKKVNYERPG